MRIKQWLILIGLMALTLGVSFAQIPTLVLVNGDVNGDNVVDDTDLLAVMFAMGQSCPSGCPEDLNGDGTVDDTDLLIVMFNIGTEGAPAFAGAVQTPQGAFSTVIALRLGDWVGSAQAVKVQLKPVGSEGDASVPIYEWTFSVGGSDTQVELTNLPAGVYTVRAFSAVAGRWLRTNGTIITEVPWIFAAPTGANKVTVYWDPVPGATGYRVRWGTASGVYPNVSSVQPADARKLSITGLATEQEYYFVVEAAYNGVWGPPSEEDRAVPHAGAIPWDSEDVNRIIPAIRQALGYPFGDLSVLSPEGRYYTEISGEGRQARATAPFVFNESASTIETVDGLLLQPTQRVGKDHTGPYRRVRTSEPSQSIGARGRFFIPPPRNPSFNISYIHVNPATHSSTRDTPHVYFGIAFGNVDMEGGIAFHPAGRGNRNRQTGEEYGVPAYDRWIPYLKVREGKDERYFPIVGDPNNPKSHIRYDQLGQEAYYGFYVDLELLPIGRDKITQLHVIVYRVLLGEPEEYVLEHLFVARARAVPNTGVRVRRVVSIAQNGIGENDPLGYRLGGSYLLNLGVAYQPLFDIQDLYPVMQVYRQGGWQWWTPDITDEVRNFPNNTIVRANYLQQERWYRERTVSIDLR
ncbi:MAG: hypothetical protein CFK49_08350 [Armatimonadetes bacterium JP3_11]|jgi:hypothetical protein|nr:MAG: hypothetical protein CFK49_08350 [Armatimonadetes bacterium JP3_11]RMH08436.1 MAG: hypothetical protein D6697_06205 [Armatimonadota bacterium]